MKVSIIIVSWNVRNLLEKCLDSIEKFSDSSIETIVIDNCSNDGTKEFLLKRKQKNLTVIQNEKNTGFAPANNQGIKISKGKYVLLLNPDTEIKNNTLKNLIAFAESKKDAGVIGCKHLNPDGSLQRSVRRFPTLFSQVLILLKLHRVFIKSKALASYYASDFDYSKSQTVDQVAGSCFFINTQLTKIIGLLDEKIPTWFEEVDFCKRVQKTNFKVYYTNSAEIIHHGNQSFQQLLPLRRQVRFFQSMHTYFKKHHGFFSVIVLNIVKYPSFLLSSVHSLITLKKND